MDGATDSSIRAPSRLLTLARDTLSPRDARGDPYAHCRTGDRPGKLWFCLVLLGEQRGLADEILLLIHKQARLLSVEENQGVGLALAKLEREERARLEAGAEKPEPKWKLLGLASLRAYLMQVRAEVRAEAERNMPLWQKFGFENDDRFQRVRRKQRRRWLVGQGHCTWQEANALDV